eukprot:jgi/Tetstr1/455321/TSEL_042156.t1
MLRLLCARRCEATLPCTGVRISNQPAKIYPSAHIPSNGGSERFNRTIEEKVLYVAVFGQVPRVGLQSLRLSDDLANSLTTETELNAALGLPRDKAIDDDSPAASEPRAEDAAAPPTDG